MKFKTKEELMDRAVLNENYKGNGLQAYDCGVIDAFLSFAERVRCFEEHFILDKTNSELYARWSKETTGKGWVDWLFDYCFGDIK